MQTLARAGEELPFWSRFGTPKATPPETPTHPADASPPTGAATGAGAWLSITPFATSPASASPPSPSPRSLGGLASEHPPLTPQMAPFEFVSKATSALRSASCRATRALTELKDDLVADLKVPAPPLQQRHTPPPTAGWTLPWARPVKSEEERQREETQRRVEELAREPWLFLVPRNGAPREGLTATGFLEEEDLMAAAEAAMEEDPCLRSLCDELVPRMMPKGTFWCRYFMAVRAIELDVFRFFDASSAQEAHGTQHQLQHQQHPLQHQQPQQQCHLKSQQPQTPPLLPSSPWANLGYTPGTPQSSLISGYSSVCSTLSSASSFDAEDTPVSSAGPHSSNSKNSKSSSCVTEGTGGCDGVHSRFMVRGPGELSPFSLLPGSSGKSITVPMSPLSLLGRGRGGCSTARATRANPGSRKNIFPEEDANAEDRGGPAVSPPTQSAVREASHSLSEADETCVVLIGAQRSASYEPEERTSSSSSVPRTSSSPSLLECGPHSGLTCPLEHEASSMEAAERADNHSSGSGTSSSSNSSSNDSSESTTSSSNDSSDSTTTTTTSSSSCCTKSSTSDCNSSRNGDSVTTDVAISAPLPVEAAPPQLDPAPGHGTPASHLPEGSAGSTGSPAPPNLCQAQRDLVHRVLAKPLPSASALLRLSAAGASALGFSSCDELLAKHNLATGSGSSARGQPGTPAATPSAASPFPHPAPPSCGTPPTAATPVAPHSARPTTPPSSSLLSMSSLFPPLASLSRSASASTYPQNALGLGLGGPSTPQLSAQTAGPAMASTPTSHPFQSSSAAPESAKEAARAVLRSGIAEAVPEAAASSPGNGGSPLSAPAVEHIVEALFAPKAAHASNSQALRSGQCEPGLTRTLHGAPEGSLVADVALSVASLSSVQEVAHFWLRFVEALRERVHKGEPIPNVPLTVRGAAVGATSRGSAGDAFPEGSEGEGSGGGLCQGPEWAEGAQPDLQACEILQHLQLLNLCIARRERRSRSLAAVPTWGGAPGSPQGAGKGLDRVAQSARGCTRVPLAPLNGRPVGGPRAPALAGSLNAQGHSGSCCSGQSDGVTAAPPCPATVERRGVKQVARGMFLLHTGEPLCVPETQETPLMTETAMRETEELIMKTRSMGAGCKQLFSDMQAFKAANPGCILQDFVRWYSPPDWSAMPYNVLQSTPVEATTRSRVFSDPPFPTEAEEDAGGHAGGNADTSAELMAETDAGGAAGGVRRALFQAGAEAVGGEVGGVSGAAEGSHPRSAQQSRPEPAVVVHKDPTPVHEGPAGESRSGYLSVRMTSPGNLWQELWGRAEAVPALEQPPLYDVEQGAESALLWLHELPPSDLLQQLFVTLVAVGLSGAQDMVRTQAGGPGPVGLDAAQEDASPSRSLACERYAAPHESPACAEQRGTLMAAEGSLGPLGVCVEECVRYATAVCCRGMGPMKQRLVASVYRVMEAARDAACADLASPSPPPSPREAPWGAGSH